MQGSGIDSQGRKIQMDWSQPKNQWRGGAPTSFTYVNQIKGAANRVIVHGETIAVDPDVIALGTRVCIDDIGWRTASDTGEKIKGKRIDVFMNVSRKQAMQFGVQEAEVFIEQ